MNLFASVPTSAVSMSAWAFTWACATTCSPKHAPTAMYAHSFRLRSEETWRERRCTTWASAPCSFPSVSRKVLKLEMANSLEVCPSVREPTASAVSSSSSFSPSLPSSLSSAAAAAPPLGEAVSSSELPPPPSSDLSESSSSSEPLSFFVFFRLLFFLFLFFFLLLLFLFLFFLFFHLLFFGILNLFLVDILLRGALGLVPVFLAFLLVCLLGVFGLLVLGQNKRGELVRHVQTRFGSARRANREDGAVLNLVDRLRQPAVRAKHELLNVFEHVRLEVACGVGTVDNSTLSVRSPSCLSTQLCPEELGYFSRVSVKGGRKLYDVR
mmetsp:Transcript_78888/g.154261  ORF Transcript_78888/g.154261 Transcript_78888/m.154261 type:complete len:325 (-) Transcript_78888:313-1287(-)